MKNVQTFNDWWESHSEVIFAEFKKKKGNFDWYECFEKCWNLAQSLETQRCAELSANRLAFEAAREKALLNGKLREFFDKQKSLDDLFADTIQE